MWTTKCSPCSCDDLWLYEKETGVICAWKQITRPKSCDGCVKGHTSPLASLCVVAQKSLGRRGLVKVECVYVCLIISVVWKWNPSSSLTGWPGFTFGVIIPTDVTIYINDSRSHNPRSPRESERQLSLWSFDLFLNGIWGVTGCGPLWKLTWLANPHISPTAPQNQTCNKIILFFSFFGGGGICFHLFHLPADTFVELQQSQGHRNDSRLLLHSCFCTTLVWGSVSYRWRWFVDELKLYWSSRVFPAIPRGGEVTPVV